MKLALAIGLRYKLASNLLSSETLMALKHQAISILNSLEKDLSILVKNYMSATNFNFCNDAISMQLSSYVTFYSIPFGVNVSNLDQLFELAVKLESSGYSPESISKILQILGM